MKIATWNVNGIRARQTQLAEWLARDRPEVVCLQELKAEMAQIPEPCKLEDYWAYWHCLRAYSGVSLHLRKDLIEQEVILGLPFAPMHESPCGLAPVPQPRADSPFAVLRSLQHRQE